MDEQYADILQDCLTRLDAGASIEECLSAFPQHRAALEGPLRTAVRLRHQGWPAMPVTTQAAVQSRLRTELAGRRTGAIPSPGPAASQSPGRPPRDPAAILEALLRSAGVRGTPPRPWLRLAAIGLGVVLALVLGAGALAAARAVIRAIAPAVAPSPTQTAAVDTFTLRGVIQQITPSAWVVEGMSVSVDEQTVIEGTPEVGASVTVVGALQDDGTLLARTVTVLAAASAPTVSPATPAPAPTEPPPTAVPTAPPPTAAPPQPTAAPAPPPVPPPAVPGDPLAALRALIEAGVADGRAQREGGAFLLEKLGEAEAAVLEDKANRLRDRLRDMQQKTREQVREGGMDASFGQQVLDGIAAIADAYRVQGLGGGNGGPGRGDDGPGRGGDDDDGGGQGGDDDD